MRLKWMDGSGGQVSDSSRMGVWRWPTATAHADSRNNSPREGKRFSFQKEMTRKETAGRNLEGSQPLARRNHGHHRHQTTDHVQALFPGNRGVARIHARHLARMPRASAPAPLVEAPSRSTRAGAARGSAARGQACRQRWWCCHGWTPHTGQ